MALKSTHKLRFYMNISLIVLVEENQRCFTVLPAEIPNKLVNRFQECGTPAPYLAFSYECRSFAVFDTNIGLA